MPADKAKTLEQLGEIKNLGPTFAERAYDSLGVRSVSDLIKAAEEGKLQSIKGIGPAKEKAILESARGANKAKPAPAPAPEAKAAAASKKPAAKKPAAKKPAAEKKPSTKAAKKSPSTKAEKPKSATKQAQTSSADSSKAGGEPKATSPNPKTEAPKAAAPKEEAKPNGAASERPRTTYRPPAATKRRPSIPGLIFKLGKKIIGRILS